jgi:FkbM family methyltransferase
MKKRLKHYAWIAANYYARVCGRPSMQGFHHALINLSLHGLGYDNAYKQPRFTGEEWFIKSVLKPAGIRTCLDIGANVGNYTKALHSHLNCIVYAFEPSTSSFVELQKVEAENAGRVVALRTAVADFNGAATLFSRGERAATATLDKNLMPIGVRGEEVPVTTVDHVVEELSLKQLDFIKIDTEGYEREVLLGARKTIERFKPRFIQFEFNILQLRRNYTLHSLSELLPEYELYRLLPRGWIKIKPAHFVDNIFMFCNIVAQRKETMDVHP